MVSISALLGSVVWAGIGAVVAWNGWTSYRGQADRVENATEVRAEITHVGVSAQRQAIDDDEGGAGATRTEYVPEVTFEYTVGGEQYAASNVGPPSEGLDETHRYPDEAGARDHFDYDVGDAVIAHVDPTRPDEGFLDPGTDAARNLTFVAVGGVMVLLGAAFAAASVVVL